MQRKALFAVVLLGLALCPIPSGATEVCDGGLAWLQDAPALDLGVLGLGIPGDQAPPIGRRNLTTTCTASCGATSVSCTISGTCTAVDRSCPTTQGYVVCGATTTYCPACACTNGTKRYTQLASCCYNEAVGQCRRTLREETCVNGNWQFSAYTCDGLNCSNCPK